MPPTYVVSSGASAGVTLINGDTLSVFNSGTVSSTRR